MYTRKEIEGIENLCRFLCEHQRILHKKIMEAANLIFKGEPKKGHNMLIMQVPIIQGSKNQWDLVDIGKQYTDLAKIRSGIDALLKDNNAPSRNQKDG